METNANFSETLDQMLAQKLLLQANPEMFHKITNTWVLTEDGKRVFVEREQDPDLPPQRLFEIQDL